MKWQKALTRAPPEDQGRAARDAGRGRPHYAARDEAAAEVKKDR
jgi:hypothetical protein